MKDLGYANGWIETPEIVKKCREQNNDFKHIGYRRAIGRCLNEYGCERCGYKYLIDSSD